MATLRQKEQITGWLFVAPFLVSLTLFFLYAAGRTLFFSFTDFDLFKAPAFVGLGNYWRLLSDQLFLTALSNTLGFAVFVTVTQTFLALLLAIQVNRAVAGRGTVRTIFYLPSIMSSAAMTLIFLWLFQREGLMTQLVQFVVNNRWYLLVFFGTWIATQFVLVFNARRRYDGVSLGDPFFLVFGLFFALAISFGLSLARVLPVYEEQFLISWLNTQAKFLFMPQTLWSVALMNIFTTIPSFMLLFLAGLQTVPTALYEAAKIDGANGFQRFRDITVPALAPVTFAAVTLSIIGTLQMFDQVAILGDAAPLQSRVTLAFYIYANAFPEGAASRIGMSSAAAIILGVLTLVIVYLQRTFGVKDTVN